MKLSGHEVDIDEGSITASIDRSISERTTVTLGGGTLLKGTLEDKNQGTRSEFSTINGGWLVAAAIAQRLVDGHDLVPFVLVSASFGVGRAAVTFGPGTEGFGRQLDETITSVDVRVGAIVGWMLDPHVAAYLAARAFGGPVLWNHDGESLTGGDKYHYAFGAGISIRFAGGVDVYAEGVPLGEKRVGGGIGVSF